MTAVQRPTTEYLVYVLLGILIGLGTAAIVGALWLLNFAIQNVLAG